MSLAFDRFIPATSVEGRYYGIYLGRGNVMVTTTASANWAGGNALQSNNSKSAAEYSVI